MELEKEYKQEKWFITMIFSVIASILSLILVFTIIAQNFHSTDLSSQITSFFVWPLSDFRPEPLERTLYLNGLLLLPFLLIGWYGFFDKKVIPKIKNETTLKIIFKTVTCVSVFLVIALFITVFLATPSYYILLRKYLPLGFLMIFPIAGLWLTKFLIYKKSPLLEKRLNIILEVFCYIVTLTLPLLTIFTIYNVNDSLSFTCHFNCVFHAVSQVFLGKEILVDLTHQYGLYPHFLNPIFQLIGLNVFKFSLVMSILLFLSYFMIFQFLKQSINNKYLAYISYIAVIFAGALISRPFSNYDVYFQYEPIRLFFPALSIFLSWKYFNTNSRFLYFTSFILYSIATLWNFDTGLVVFLSWLAVLIYQELVENSGIIAAKKILKHLFYCFSTLILVFVIYTISMKLTYGHFPNYLESLNFQSTFYKYGFFMLPMKIFYPWTLIALAYIVGLAMSIKPFFEKKILPVGKSIFYLSILGFGIFSYYQGRSHDLNIIAINYPAFLLLAILTDKALSNHSSFHIKAFPSFKGMATISLTFLIFLNFAMIGEYPSLISFINKKFAVITTKTPNKITQNITFLKANIKPKEKVLILSFHSGIYYSESKADNPLKLPGVLEMFTQKEYKTAYDFLNTTKDKIVIDDTFIDQFPSPYKTKILNILIHKKKLIEINANKMMILY